jgi:hypothetical protein
VIWILVILLFLPGAALLRLRQQGWNRMEALRVGLLTLVCLAISGPFINDGGLGTGEAMNYSLAVADTITQARAGTFPVHVGQSEFAFNGRVHPLRTAVYFTHVPVLLDALTFRQLSFWGLQNLSIALSLWLGVFLMYACLRCSVEQAPWLAFALAALFGLSPGLLAPAYGMDLYMTVTAAPFVVLSIFGATQSFSARTFARYAWMAVGLAGTWLAHPPVAAWTSLACTGIVGTSWLSQRPRIGAAINLLVAAVLGALLSGWAFTAALSLREDIVAASPAAAGLISEQVAATTKLVGWAGLLPVRSGGAELGDYQLGYAGWVMLFVAALVSLRRGTILVKSMLAVAAFLFVLTLPIPFLHERLWLAMPPIFGLLTNSWPMQRAYLLLATIAMFTFAFGWPHVAPIFASGHPRRRQAWAVVACLCVWTTLQGWSFVSRGYHTRNIATGVAAAHRSSNVDLTGVAYAFMPIPRQFYHGPRDPERELRLLADDAVLPVTLNEPPPAGSEGRWTAALRSAGDSAGMRHFETSIVIEPGHRYRLKFTFLTEPLTGVLILKGSHGLYRQYLLPGRSGGLGFGMQLGNRQDITLWTDSPETETVSLALALGQDTPLLPDVIATIELSSYDPAALPLSLVSLVPSLIVEADVAEYGWLETPRLFLAGYQATVDGVAVVPRRSGDGLTLVPVSPGRRRIELKYEPPTLLRQSAAITLGGWLLVLGFGVTSAIRPLRRKPTPSAERFRRVPPLAVGAAGLFAGVWILPALPPNTDRPRRGEPGPMTFRLALPIDALGKAEPLVSAGTGPGSATVFVRYDSPSTIRLGIDVWGYGPRESAPLPVNYAEPQTIRLTTGLLYDRAQPALSASLGVEPATWLQSWTQFWLNGEEVFFEPEPPRSMAPEPFGLLRAVSGDGSYQHRFTGVMIEMSQEPAGADLIPFPTAGKLSTDSAPLQLTVLLPANQIGQAEPLVSIGDDKIGTCLFIHYLDRGRIRLGIGGPGSDFVSSEALVVDYQEPVTIAISHAAFFPAGPEGFPGYSPAQREQLLARTRVAINGTWILTGPLLDPADRVSGPVRFGQNHVGATYPSPTFSGRFIGSGRLETAAWPLRPGNPELALAPGTVGPIEVTVRLPQEMYGRQQPIFVAGKPGEAAIVFVHYLDRDHIRVGVDVWGKALYFSEPIATDYLTPQRVRISMTSLFPADHPDLQALPETDRELRRNTLAVAVNDVTAINETIFSYDSPPEQMTPGRSGIGGSNTEAAFLGDVLDVKRLPLLGP